MKGQIMSEVARQHLGGGNHVTRIANVWGNTFHCSSHSGLRKLISSQFSYEKYAGVYRQSAPLRHDLCRAGHAMAGVWIVLSLVMLVYVDEAVLSPFWKWLARSGVPNVAILIPTAFFLSVASPTASQPNGLMNLAYIGALILAGAVLILGVGLIRAAWRIER